MTDITLEWASAEVTATGIDLALHVPLSARPDPDWLREFEGLRVSRHLEARGNAWTAEPVDERNAIRVLRVTPGDETAIREALVEMVSLATARAERVRAEEAAARRREEEELAQARQQAAEMTERFRSLAPAPAAPAETGAAEQSHGFQQRLRTFEASREEAASEPAYGQTAVGG
jgi:hypothetical protein